MKAFTYIAPIAAALTLTGCVAHQVEPPPLSGPSDLALSLSVTASPETINQDGASQSRITISAIGPDGKAKASLPVRVDMALSGVAQDFGTLSARSVVTNTDGKAFVVYTEPPSPVGGITGTCYVRRHRRHRVGIRVGNVRHGGTGERNDTPRAAGCHPASDWHAEGRVCLLATERHPCRK